MWKQHTLLQLLQIVELPVLDGILTSVAQPEPQERVLLSNCQDLVIPNSFVDKEVIQSLNLPQSVPELNSQPQSVEHCILLGPVFSSDLIQSLYVSFSLFQTHYLFPPPTPFTVPSATPRLDPWLVAAADCLEHFPDQLIVVAGEHLLQQGGAVAQGDETLATTKRILFDIIAKHYNGQDRKAFISGHYLDIHMAILHLLGEAGMPVHV